MRRKKVVLDYSGLKDDELNTLAGKVLDCLDGHETFIDPPVELEVLEEQITDFRLKWQKASRGGSLLEIALKNDAKDIIAFSLKEIAFYVNKIGRGSHSTLLSSGLILEADRKASQAPDQVIGVELRDGKQKGQLEVRFAPLKAAALYEYEIASSLTEDAEPDWNEVFQASSSLNNIYAIAKPDHIYYLRVRARNKRGIGDWSEVASLKTR